MIGDERGFTLVEVLLASVILAAAVLSGFQALDASRRLSLVAERQTTMAHRAQSELEALKSMPYSQLGLTGTSSAWSSNQSDPNGVNTPSGSCPGGTSVPTYQYDHSTNPSTATEPLVIDGCPYTINGSSTTFAGGTVAPVQAWSNGAYSGSVYDFITFASDPNCTGAYCPTTNDYKRLTVVVTMTGATHPPKPAIVSTLVADPNVNSKFNLTQNPTTLCTLGSQTGSCSSTAPGTPSTYVFCDGSYSGGCSSTGPSCSGNALNQTLVAVGLTPAAPDAAGTSLPAETCTTGGTPSPPCYATNLLANCQGLPIVPSGSSTCGSSPPLDNTKSHSWVGPTIPTGTSVNLTGAGAMTTFLEATGGAAVNATLCLRLYVVPNTSLGLLNSLLSTPISATISASVTAQAGIPTPVTFTFPASAIAANTAVSATTGPVRIEFVVWLAASTQSVEMLYDQAQAATEVTLMTQ